jgi:SAM-dependent methyltransferase
MPSSNERKYQSSNPVVRALLDRFLAKIAARVASVSPARVLDVGCGEGLVVSHLRGRGLRFDYLGVDVSAAAIATAKHREPELRFAESDVLTSAMPPGPWDLVLCLEVLEHLRDPRAALRRLAAAARGSGGEPGQVLVSVPWEPWFRLGNLARGQHLAQLGNHPEHVQAFGRGSLRALLEGELEAVRVEGCLPWLVGVGRARG